MRFDIEPLRFEIALAEVKEKAAEAELGRLFNTFESAIWEARPAAATMTIL